MVATELVYGIYSLIVMMARKLVSLGWVLCVEYLLVRVEMERLRLERESLVVRVGNGRLWLMRLDIISVLVSGRLSSFMPCLGETLC